MSPRRRRPGGRWHYWPLLAGVVLVLILFATSHWQAEGGLAALNELRRQAARTEHLDRLLVQLMDTENAVRGYLLSGNRAYLAPYQENRATANATLEAIRRDLADPAYDEALADLGGLVAIKLRSLDLAVERGMVGDETRNPGRRYTDRIRSRIQGLQLRVAAEGEASFLRAAAHVERTRWVLATLAAGALGLLVLLYLVIERQLALREAMAGLLRSENQRLDALVQARTAELNDLATYLTRSRESEKAALARELHDELGALLTAARIESAGLRRQLDLPAAHPVRARLARLDARLAEGIALKQRIIDGLRPPLLDTLGLVPTLRVLADEFLQGGGPALTVDLPAGEMDLPPEQALAIFRIAQEALTNIRRHAHARHARLHLAPQGDALTLDISDDGVGLPPGGPAARHGLAGMRHRVQMCAGHLQLDSAPGQGTRIRVQMPLPRPAEEAAGVTPVPVAAPPPFGQHGTPA